LEPLVIIGLRTDESTQILVFVCAPLVLLLVLLIILLRRYDRRKVSFPNYSLTISKVGPTAAYLLYRSDNAALEFVSELRKGKKFFKSAIYVMVPAELPNEEIHKIVPDLVLGLDKLRYDYLIFRKTGSRPIPNERCEAAVTELRRMGVELQQPIDKDRVSRAVIRNITNRWDGQASATISKVRSLTRQAAGASDNIEVLACSDSGLRLKERED
jgi:hypothetical protein